jgi:hypothetical protein
MGERVNVKRELIRLQKERIAELEAEVARLTEPVQVWGGTLNPAAVTSADGQITTTAGPATFTRDVLSCGCKPVIRPPKAARDVLGAAHPARDVVQS